MTKFISCLDGSYLNIDSIEKILVCDEYGINVIIEEKNQKDIFQIISPNFENRDEAQDWLDKFMDKHGLCIEETTL